MGDFSCWELFQVASFDPFEDKPHLLIYLNGSDPIFILFRAIYLGLSFQCHRQRNREVKVLIAFGLLCDKS